MRDVCVVGVGMSQWGEVWRKSLRQLFVDAASEAIKNSGVDHIDSLYVGCMSGGMFVGQEHLGALMADYMGMRGIPAMRVEWHVDARGVHGSYFVSVRYRHGRWCRKNDRLCR